LNRGARHWLDNGRIVTAEAGSVGALVDHPSHGSPTADALLPAGVFVGMDAEAQRSILNELRDMHADMAAWRRQDEIERRVDRDRSTDDRLDQVEGNQARYWGCCARSTRVTTASAVGGRQRLPVRSLSGPVAPDHVGVVDGIVGSGIPQRRDGEATQAPALLRLFVAGRDRGRGFHEMMQRRTHRPKGQDRSVVGGVDPGAFQGQAGAGHDASAVTKSPA